SNHRVPAEWERHERTLICWPARDELWGEHRARAVDEYVGVAAAVAQFEPVTVFAPPRYAAEAESAVAEIAGDVSVVEIAIDDSWARDSGPIYAIDASGSRVIVDVTFNSWGGKFLPYADDAALARRWAERSGVPVVDEPMVLEGGSVSVDGAGTVLTTEQCLLHPNRNPAMSREQIEARLHRVLGASNVVWLPYGLALDDDTDGHVDNVAAFVAPGSVLLQGCDDPDEEDHHRMRANAGAIATATDADGTPLSAVEVPVLPFVDLGDERLVVPYLNLYLCNGGAVVPVSGHPADADVLGLIAEQLPGRQVVAVPAIAIAFGGGGPHCITQQVPADPSPTVEGASCS
ncbi:MAG: agmatine/peptidylarginine deiminase, partial [Actinomycetes bacterium]